MPVSDKQVEEVFPLPCATKLRVLVLSSPPWGVLNRETEPHDIALTKENIKVGLLRCDLYDSFMRITRRVIELVLLLSLVKNMHITQRVMTKHVSEKHAHHTTCDYTGLVVIFGQKHAHHKTYDLLSTL